MEQIASFLAGLGTGGVVALLVVGVVFWWMGRRR